MFDLKAEEQRKNSSVQTSLMHCTTAIIQNIKTWQAFDLQE